jgi:hypothetical protein
MTTPRDNAAEVDRLPAPPTPETEALAAATAHIHADAQDTPETYLNETIVPGGGE